MTATETGRALSVRAAGVVTISPLRAALTSNPLFPVVGFPASLYLTVSNTGNAPLPGIQAHLSLMTGTLFVDHFAGPLPSAPATIKPGGMQVFTWTYSVTGAGALVWTATASSGPTGSEPPGATASMRIPALFPVRLATSLAPNPVHITGGEWFSLAVTVSNTGGVATTEVLPSLVIDQGSALANLEAGPDSDQAAALKPGQSKRFVFTYSAHGSGTVTFTGTVTARADLEPPGLISRGADSVRATSRSWLEKAGRTGSRWKAGMNRWLFPPEPPPPLEPPFIGFETEAEAGWRTEGFVRIARSQEHARDGESSLRAEFLVPTDLTLSPSGSFLPAVRLSALPRVGEFRLEPRDWTPFTSLKLDCYADAPEPVNFHVALTDRRGYRYEAMRRLTPLSATVVEIPLAGAADARLDLAHVAELAFAVDTTGLAERPVLYLDHLRFAVPVSGTSLWSTTATGIKAAGTPAP